LVQLISDHAIGENSLQLELTESAATAVSDIGERLTRLKSAGVMLAIDDFGTGQSALSHLQELPFDALKIDRSFVSGAGRLREGRAATLMRSIIQLAHGLGFDVVAEGIESASDARWLTELGCDYGQGYFFSPPLPSCDVPAFLSGFPNSIAQVENAAASGVPGVGGEPGDVDSQPP
jgi:EAL domain-containing protein (putative c-di-GMP-specific phosphodiesterase class I)